MYLYFRVLFKINELAKRKLANLTFLTYLRGTTLKFPYRNFRTLIYNGNINAYNKIKINAKLGTNENGEVKQFLVVNVTLVSIGLSQNW
jgi:hypothetical protein